jgi:hypothetical protein
VGRRGFVVDEVDGSGQPVGFLLIIALSNELDYASLDWKARGWAKRKHARMEEGGDAPAT